MTKSFYLIYFFIFITFNIFGVQKTYNDNGKIKKHKVIKEFYDNGVLKQKRTFGSFLKKGRQLNYDTLGNRTIKGKFYYLTTKHGTWKTYERGKLVKKEKYKFGRKKNTLVTSDGKKIKCFLTMGYGLFNRGVCEKSKDKYKVTYISVASCIISNNLLFKTAIHNFFVKSSLIIKHGFNWESKIDDTCGFQKVRIKL